MRGHRYEGMPYMPTTPEYVGQLEFRAGHVLRVKLRHGRTFDKVLRGNIVMRSSIFLSERTMCMGDSPTSTACYVEMDLIICIVTYSESVSSA